MFVTQVLKNWQWQDVVVGSQCGHLQSTVREERVLRKGQPEVLGSTAKLEKAILIRASIRHNKLPEIEACSFHPPLSHTKPLPLPSGCSTA